jgi:tetratricopeptide (TPR) repeat protein
MNSIFFYSQSTSKRKNILFCLFIVFIISNYSPKNCLADGKRIFDDNRRSVVSIYAFDRDGNQIGQASGFIVRKNGAVVTNYHILSNAFEIKVKAEGTMLDVKGLLYVDKENDIIMLKIEDKNFPEVKIHYGEIGPKGQKIYILGSPEGEEKILLDGTLSMIKDITRVRKLLLITAPVTKGNSGSPVFDENGEVIGIATFLVEEPQPYYFAMPVDQIKNKLSLEKVLPMQKKYLNDYYETAEYWFNLGAAYESLGLNNYASGAYQKAVKINPEDAVYYYRLGAVYELMDIHSFAIDAYRTAIIIKGDYIEAYYGLGVSYLLSHMNKEAIEAFQQIIRINPDDFMAHYGLAIVYADSQMNAEAIEYCKQALKIKPDSAATHFILGTLYISLDHEAALKEYGILQNLSPQYANELSKFLAAKGISTSKTMDLSKQETSKSEATAALEKEPSAPAAPTISRQEAPQQESSNKEVISPLASTALLTNPPLPAQDMTAENYSERESDQASPVKPEPAVSALPLQDQKTHEITHEEVDDFMKRYSSAYSRGDLKTFMSLFSGSVIDDNRLHYNEVQEAYRTTFSEKINLYRVNSMIITLNGQSASVSGFYDLTRYASEEARWIRYTGKIQWTLIRENNELKIISLNYDK